jgi:hypothetical protein
MNEIDLTAIPPMPDYSDVTADEVAELRSRAVHECARVTVALSKQQPDAAINVMAHGAWLALLNFSTAREAFNNQQRTVN